MPGYTFRQYDSRWGNKNYNGSSTMAMAGCGPTACADLIYSINKKITPWTTAKFMKQHGYAIYNNGTAWAGIPACLKHFGMENVEQQRTMKAVFNKMAKGHLAVLLFTGGSRGGVTWTLGGHYLASTGYKTNNSLHFLYMRDPGGRRNDGWFCYETKMKGLISAAWTCSFSAKSSIQPIKKKEKTTYKGSYPTAKVSQNTGTSKNIKKWQTFLCWWGPDVKKDGIFGTDTKEKTIAFQKKYNLKPDGVVGTKTLKKAKEVGKTEKH